MSSWLIAAVGVVYLYVGVEQYFKGNGNMTIIFTGYAFSNIGLYLNAK